MHIGIHRRFEEAVGVASQRLRVIHRCIRIGHQVVLTGAVVGVDRNTDAGRDAQQAVGHVKWLQNDPQHFVGERRRIGRFGYSRQQHEFVATDAGDRIL